MSYEEFLEQVKGQIQAKLGKDMSVSVFPVRKNNAVLLDGLSILGQGDNLSPAIYLNGYYREFLNGKTLEEIGEDILDCYQRGKKSGHFDMEPFRNPDRARERIVCRLINYDKNRVLLRDVPHRSFLNLAIVYYYLVESRELGEASILVKKEFLSLWGLDEEYLHRIALENTRRLLPWDFLSMSQMLHGVTSTDFWREEPELPLYILSNREKYFGSVWITDSRVLEQIGEELREDYYILPSSVHECMILPVSLQANVGELQAMVREINDTQVEPEEVLADTVYRYDRRQKRLETAAG